MGALAGTALLPGMGTAVGGALGGALGYVAGKLGMRKGIEWAHHSAVRMRSRALARWEETGRRLGVRPYAEGGFARPVPALAPAGVSAVTTPAVNINLNFDLTGLVRQVVINNSSDIEAAIDKITGVIADNLRSAFQNMTKE